MMSPLFEPITIRRTTLANRFVMPAMQRGHCIDGAPTEALADYYRRRVEGGIALVIGESCAVDHVSATIQPTSGRMNAATKSAWGDCVDAVRGAGGHMLIQLWHEGALRVAPDDWTLSPSGRAHAARANGRAATTAELGEIRDAFVAAARDAADIGAAGIEIHACHGYMLDQFLWRETNDRGDGYGGDDIRQRARLPAEIAAGVRSECGEDFLISFRFSQWKEVNYGARIAADPVELEALVTMMRDAGADMIHASARRFWEAEWPGDPRGIAGWTRALSGLPTIAVGSVGLDIDVMSQLIDGGEGNVRAEESIAALEERMRAGEFDLVAVGRAVIGDPDWVNKVRERRFGEIRGFERADLGALSWNLDIVHEAHGVQ
jgi:2,4-dienoyl-CoA reductase-like NADH-dependent reductase (Old Yellow Enzyme family)